MVLNKVDSIYEKEYNQIKGRFMYATFRDAKNNIDYIHVEGGCFLLHESTSFHGMKSTTKK